jgi:hypothetical protein
MTRSFRTLTLTLAVTVASLLAVASARADGGTPPASQLTDTSHQVADIQHKVADLLAKGQVARGGKLAAAANCGYGEPSQVFLPWGDLASYSLASEGDFSDTSQWTFKHTAVGADHDPYTASGGSLLLAQGDSEAISPAMCVNLDNPTIRLFMKDSGGNGKSDVKLDVLYEDLNSKVQHLTLARLRAGSGWSPTIAIPIAVNVLSTASANGWTAVAFDFKVEGLQKGETLQLDGLYVDPYKSG